MTTLITGAGLVGAAFGRCALERGERLIFVDAQPRDEFLRVQLGAEARYEIVKADVRDLPALVDVMRACAADVVVHTAGLIGKRVSADLATAFQVNVQGSANVAAAVHAAGVRRLVHVSSFGVYQWQAAKAPVGESFPRGGGGPYASFNVAREAVLEAYAQSCGFELIILRPASVFGLGHFWSGSRGGRKIQDLLVAGLRGEPLELDGDAAGADDYVYAKDLGAAIDRAAVVALPSPSVINIGSGRLTTLAALVDAAKRALSGLEVIVVGPTARGKAAPLDVAAAKRLLGWEPAYSLEAAMEDYVGDLRRLGIDRVDVLQR